MAKDKGDGTKPPKKPRQRAPNKKSNIINLEAAKLGLKRGKGDTAAPPETAATQAGARAGRRKPGPVGHVPDDDSKAMVAALRAAGATKETIALALDIHVDTLDKHYALQLDRGFEVIAAKIVAGATEKALKGDFKAQRFWLETHMGWGKRVPRNMGPSVLGHGQAFDAAPIVGIPAPGQGEEPGRFGMGDAVPPPPNAQGRIPIVMRIGLEQKDIQTKDKVKEGEDQ